MSAGTASEGRGLITISFTALLYGVVIDASLHRFETLDWSPPNLLLAVALFIIVQDFFFYHEDMKRLNLLLKAQALAAQAEGKTSPADRARFEWTRRKEEIAIFLLDLLLLTAWYALSLSAHYPLPVYLTFLAGFFFTVCVWNAVGPDMPRWRRFFKWSPWVVLLVAAAGAGIAIKRLGWSFHRDEHASFDAWGDLHWRLLLTPLAFFILWRIVYCVGFWKIIKDEVTALIDLISPPHSAAAMTAEKRDLVG